MTSTVDLQEAINALDRPTRLGIVHGLSRAAGNTDIELLAALGRFIADGQDGGQLVKVIGALTPTGRRQFASLAANQRDHKAVDGEHAIAHFWNEVMCLLLAIEDTRKAETNTLNDLYAL